MEFLKKHWLGVAICLLIVGIVVYGYSAGWFTAAADDIKKKTADALAAGSEAVKPAATEPGPALTTNQNAATDPAAMFTA